MLKNPSSQRSYAGSTVGSTVSVKRVTVPSTSPSNNNTPSADWARKRQGKKDDAFRKKLDQELGKKMSSKRATRTVRPAHGTVGSLRPSQALTLPDTATVVDAARIMAAKRADAILVIDKDSTLAGIMTDKDLAFRVVAEGLDIHSTLVSQVMTKNPFCVTTDTNATDALNKMVNGGFRHLPCLNGDGDVVGLLDITKCLYEALQKLEKAHKSSQQLVEALEGMQSEWAQITNPQLQSYVDIMREKMASPDLNVILDEHHRVAEIQAKTTVRDASKAMKQAHSTASLIMEGGRIAGIFTTKDIVVRVLAANLEPERTSVVRVMTPHPDTVHSSMTILDALKKMHDKHYLHLPVVDDQNHMAGLVDVLQVSLAILRQMATMQGDSSSDGVAWSKLWEAGSIKDDTGSDISASDMRSSMVPSSEMQYSVTKVGSLTNASPESPADVGSEFMFKFKDSGGQAHRFASSSRSFKELHGKILEKMGGNKTNSNVTLSYRDEENDQVVILQDADVVDAVHMALRNRWPLIHLTVTALSSGQGVEGKETRQSSTGSTPLPGGLDPMMLAGGVGIGLGVGLALMFALARK
ncbi:hypothetical protein BGX34_010279 [Mortierella sp. NVP85]|nr:hypothetical protein BGX34_010279 [Mortierella sp. NVP85]